MGAAPSPAATTSRRLLWVILAAVGGLLLVTLIIVLVVWRGGAGTPSAGTAPTSTRPTPSASAAPMAVPAAPVTGPRPTSCDAIYSPDMLATFSDSSTLNPAWVEEDESAAFVGTNDPALVSVVEDLDHLTCVWGEDAGASDSGLITNVVFVTAEQSEAAHQSLLALDQSCYEELGGIRCVAEDPDSDQGVAGESHFLRDGVWLATRYVNAGPDGYTHDMIATIWAGE